jgi:transposase
MKKNWIIGIDVAGNGIHYQIQNAEGLPLSNGPAAKNMDGYLSFTQACQQAGVVWKNCLIAIEATGRHHLPWRERLVDEGASVYALNPLLTRACPNNWIFARIGSADHINVVRSFH